MRIKRNTTIFCMFKKLLVKDRENRQKDEETPYFIYKFYVTTKNNNKGKGKIYIILGSYFTYI